jgi:single-stranded-DNA-specific exonuclease
LPEIAGLPPLAVQLLYNRGITEPGQIKPFLAADKQLHAEPFLLPDMDKAIARIYRALLLGENIAVYGDFDVDGVCGTALLVQGLSHLGANVTPYIPHRVKEGYGLNPASIKSLCQQGNTLVITVDCGIRGTSEVERARRMGMDIIITDHHSISTPIPPAIAVVNPCRQDSAYPFSQLAGVGVAFKLLEALFQSLGKEGDLDELLDLVVLGTVADMVPLISENRYLAKQGLEILNKTERIGLQEMIDVAGLRPGNLGTESISWVLGPRLNAAGRLDRALTSYRLLMTSSPQEAYLLAQELEQKNALRQRLTKEVLAKAREKLCRTGIDAPLLMVGEEDYHPGIVGLVAGRLAEEFYRPTLVFKISQNTTQGSARSIPEFNIIAALGECQDLLLRFGGHPAAAGFALPTDNLTLLQQRLLDIADRQLSGVDLQPCLTVEAEVPLSTLNGETFTTIERLAPFGKGNPVPTFLSRKVQLLDRHQVGGNQAHLKLKLREGNILWKGIGFDLGHLIAEVTPSLDIVYNLAIDRWGSEDVLTLNILDFTPAA